MTVSSELTYVVSVSRISCVIWSRVRFIFSSSVRKGAGVSTAGAGVGAAVVAVAVVGAVGARVASTVAVAVSAVATSTAAEMGVSFDGLDERGVCATVGGEDGLGGRMGEEEGFGGRLGAEEGLGGKLGEEDIGEGTSVFEGGDADASTNWPIKRGVALVSNVSGLWYFTKSSVASLPH